MRFVFGPFVLDADRGALLRDGAPLASGQRALRVLQTLLAARGTAVSKADLMAAAWPGLVVEDSNLSVQIAALRKLLGADRDGYDWIVTVPRLGYRFAGAFGEQAPAPAGQATARPSIAVLPFGNLSGDPAHEYVADGIAEDLIDALTRFRWFSVAGRPASFAFRGRRADPKTIAQELGVGYLIGGSVRRSGTRLRVSAELIDAASGACLWADRFDAELDDVLAMQDRIAQQVAGAIEPELLLNAGGQARRRAGSGTAWELVAQGSWYFHQVTRPTHWQARELFRRACRIDAELMEARLWLARVSAGIIAFGWSDDCPADGREGLEAGLQAVRMDEKSPYANYALSIVAVQTDSFELSIRAAEKAIELSPSFALGHLVRGMALLYAGDAAAALPPLERGLALNRHDPHNFVWTCVLALAYLFDGRPDDALRLAVASTKARPAWRPAVEVAAAGCAAAGRPDAARQWLEQARTLERPSGDGMAPLWRHNREWTERMRAWLDAANDDTA